MLRKEKGFTLIELLIVVAIIGIIAAIAVPNLLTAIQRSKQKRSMADLRAMGTALGSYQVDYNKYPTLTPVTDFEPTRVMGSNGQLYYKGSVKDGWGNGYRYLSADGESYTLCSQGKNAAVGGTGEFDKDLAHVDGAMFEAGVFTGSCN